MTFRSVLRLLGMGLAILTFALAILTVRSSAGNRQWTVRAGNALMTYALAERTLQLNLLNARAGLLRNYDPVNANLASARESLAHLRALPLRTATRSALASLIAGNERQEDLVERFKSDNALLQNSLARFTAGDVTQVPAQKILSARILKLTLDTSPQTVGDARAALARVRPAPDGTIGAQLVSHARLLVCVLPELDDLLHAIRAMRMEDRTDRLQAAVGQETSERMASTRRYVVSLAISIVLLVIDVVWLLMAQRIRARELRVQADNERLSAAIATPLIDAANGNFADRIYEALNRLAAHISARRIQLTIPGVPYCSLIAWPASVRESDWLGRLVKAADLDRAWVDDRVVVSRQQGGVTTALGRAMAATGTENLVLLRVLDPFRVIIGFEPDEASTIQRRDLVAAVASAIVSIAHGARRQVMQRERERLERTLARARRMEAIGTMASGVAHNFNNIIGAIGGYAEMGRERSRAGSAERHDFEEIQDAVERAQHLVDDILSFGRQGRSAKRPLDLRDVLTRSVGLLAASSRAGSVISPNFADSGYPVLGAAGDLQQVFLNLGNNALQAGEGKPVTIAVDRVRLVSERHLSHANLEPGEYVVVSVSDNGPGIRDVAMRRLFEPFFTTKPCGTGLGLSTAWEVVQDHGGTIDVENLPGVGARFGVWLPVTANGIIAKEGNGARILLLAEPERLGEIEDLLAELGYEPIGCPLTTCAEILPALMADADAVLVAAAGSARTKALISEVISMLEGRQLILATPDDEIADTSRLAARLTYPIVPAELSRTLADVTGDFPAVSMAC